MPTHQHNRVYFTPEVATLILRRLVNGESLLRICGPDREEGLPDRHTVYEHMHQDKDFRRRYLLAREAQAEFLSDEAMEIADGRDLTPGQEGNVGWAWLRVSVRQWKAGVMAPRLFGKRGEWRDELADLEAEAEAEARPASEAIVAAQIVALLDHVRRRMVERGDVVTGDDWVDFGAAAYAEERDERREGEPEDGGTEPPD